MLLIVLCREWRGVEFQEGWFRMEIFCRDQENGLSLPSLFELQMGSERACLFSTGNKLIPLFAILGTWCHEVIEYQYSYIYNSHFQSGHEAQKSL
jgi:hypothetical protein